LLFGESRTSAWLSVSLSRWKITIADPALLFDDSAAVDLDLVSRASFRFLSSTEADHESLSHSFLLGKSSIQNLILRFYEPNSGSIQFDGTGSFPFLHTSSPPNPSSPLSLPPLLPSSFSSRHHLLQPSLLPFRHRLRLSRIHRLHRFHPRQHRLRSARWRSDEGTGRGSGGGGWMRVCVGSGERV